MAVAVVVVLAVVVVVLVLAAAGMGLPCTTLSAARMTTPGTKSLTCISSDGCVWEEDVLSEMPSSVGFLYDFFAPIVFPNL